ncbi:hypothetical protein BO86DRAFT_402098 [Aspergillus japonicus CBS 114.51]|uniref:Uncharacterized protein n=1 Tax=Aspergillus japonicus CBS 114.51 TaxID=1448312 RepID=A0A8T8WTU4_ASPJA|nr:hypothetical protein BO86DRAFT_402098 [Aspergillus japonicus CBS 114.51]RAH79074.1 hypothetical protein BO86DRAFT_402098 [Aspergillus japonicus CBS 114.51]
MRHLKQILLSHRDKFVRDCLTAIAAAVAEQRPDLGPDVSGSAPLSTAKRFRFILLVSENKARRSPGRPQQTPSKNTVESKQTRSPPTKADPSPSTSAALRRLAAVRRMPVDAHSNKELSKVGTHFLGSCLLRVHDWLKPVLLPLQDVGLFPFLPRRQCLHQVFLYQFSVPGLPSTQIRSARTIHDVKCNLRGEAGKASSKEGALNTQHGHITLAAKLPDTLPAVSHLLADKNGWNVWLHKILTSLRSHRAEGLLDASLPRLRPTSPHFDTWEQWSLLVGGWLTKRIDLMTRPSR